jgi:Uncharacterized protein conserved in bacteria
MEHNPKVDAFITGAQKWQKEFETLRSLFDDFALTEELKWGVPCYTYEGKNVALIHGFKEYCAILFVKGALLKDTEGILVQQTENVQAGRQIRFASTAEISALEPTMKAYISEAIEIEKAGLKVEFNSASENMLPPEFKKRLDESPALKAAFDALTPGRKRAYTLYFSQPKQEKTREARIEKCLEAILSGKGLND